MDEESKWLTSWTSPSELILSFGIGFLLLFQTSQHSKCAQLSYPSRRLVGERVDVEAARLRLPCLRVDCDDLGIPSRAMATFSPDLRPYDHLARLWLRARQRAGKSRDQLTLKLLSDGLAVLAVSGRTRSLWPNLAVKLFSGAYLGSSPCSPHRMRRGRVCRVRAT